MSATKFSVIGERIRKARTSFGITQEEFAQKCGVNRTAVIRWEAGTSKPSRFLEKIAKVLDVSTDWLLTGHADGSWDELMLQVNIPSAFHESTPELPYPTPLLLNWFRQYARSKDGKKTMEEEFKCWETLRAISTLDPRVILLALRLRRLNEKGLGKITTYLNDIEMTDAYTLPTTSEEKLFGAFMTQKEIEEGRKRMRDLTDSHDEVLPSFLTKFQQKKLRGK